MTVDVVIEDLGESREEATFVGWLKDVGDKVSKTEPIAEIMTDKVSQEIESPASGTFLSQNIEPDDQVSVNQIIGVIEEDA